MYSAAEAQIKDICAYLKWQLKGIVTVPNMAEKGSMHTAPGLQKVREFAASLKG